MALSKDLISQFAKLAINDKTSNTETTLYGTIVESNGSTYIQLDGSDMYTPISSTIKVQNGERVTAIIKNHQVIVTGNMTSPSTTTVDMQGVMLDHSDFKNAVDEAMSDLEVTVKEDAYTNYELYNAIEKELQTKFSELGKYIRFGENGIEIGSNENTLKLTLDSDVIRFEKNNETVGYWDGVNFHTGNIFVDVTEKAQFGNFAYVPRSDGSLMFLKVDETLGTNIFNILMGCTFGSGVTRYTRYGFNGADVDIDPTTGGTATACIFNPGSGILDPTKTYRIECILNNAQLYIKKASNNEDILLGETNGKHSYIASGIGSIYILVRDRLVGSYTFRDMKVREVT